LITLLLSWIFIEESGNKIENAHKLRNVKKRDTQKLDTMALPVPGKHPMYKRS